MPMSDDYVVQELCKRGDLQFWLDIQSGEFHAHVNGISLILTGGDETPITLLVVRDDGEQVKIEAPPARPIRKFVRSIQQREKSEEESLRDQVDERIRRGLGVLLARAERQWSDGSAREYQKAYEAQMKDEIFEQLLHGKHKSASSS